MTDIMSKEKEYQGVLDELYSLSDKELTTCFPSCKNANDVLQEYSLGYIDQKIKEYATIAVQGGLPRERKEQIPDIITLHWLLGQDEGYDKEELDGLIRDAENTGHKLQGVVLWYDSRKRTGWLYRQIHGTIRNILITDEGMSNTLNGNLTIGDRIEFFPAINEQGMVCAKDVVRIGKIERATRSIFIGNGVELWPREIIRYGKSNSMMFTIKRLNGKITKSDIYKNGYTSKDFDYVYIITRHRGEWRFYQEGSPLKGNGRVDNLNKLLQELDQKILRFQYSPNIVKTKSEKLMERDLLEVKEEKNLEALKGATWYRNRMIGELLKIGFSKNAAKQLMLPLGNIEKRFRKGSLTVSEEELLKQARILVKNHTPEPSADKKVTWFRLYVYSELLREGYSQKDAKELLEKSGFYSFMEGKKWSVLKDFHPGKMAENILQGKKVE